MPRSSKAQTIVCVICSREKNQSPERIPARERYVGTHIKLVEEIALKQGAQFFILSGKLGLRHSLETVELYDHPLTEGQVSRLVAKVCGQLLKLPFAVEEIQFYTKDKPVWRLYRKVIEQAAVKAKIKMQIVELLPNA